MRFGDISILKNHACLIFKTLKKEKKMKMQIIFNFNFIYNNSLVTARNSCTDREDKLI